MSDGTTDGFLEAPGILSPEEERRQILIAGELSSPFFSATFFPDVFFSPVNELQEQIYNVVDARDSKGLPAYRFICISAPRGIGKTSIAKGLAAKAICYRRRRFIPWISNSATVATLQTENLKFMLQTSASVLKHIGSIKSRRDKDIETQFSKEAWVATLPVDSSDSPYRGTMIFPRGAGQQIRGILFGSARPDFIIVDDLEDSEEVDNKDIRERNWRWLNADVMKAISLYDTDFQIVYIDTLKHEDSVLARLLEDKKWKSLCLSLCDQDYHTKVPTLYSDADIAAMVEEHRANHTLDIFGRECMSEPIPKEAATFKREYFKYYDEAQAQLKDKAGVESVVIIDPANTTNPTSDYSAVGGISHDRATGAIYIRDIEAGYFHPDECAAKAFDMADRLGTNTIGLETDNGGEFTLYPYEMLMQTLGRFYNIVELKARGKKTEMKGKDRSKFGRIAALLPFYRRGLIYHNPTCCGALETQLLTFPKCKRDDVADMTAYFIELFGLGGLSFPNLGKLQEKSGQHGQVPTIPISDSIDDESEFAELRKLSLPSLDTGLLQPTYYRTRGYAALYS